MFFLEDDFVVSKKNHHFRHWTACIAHVQHKTDIEILLPSTVIILPPISYLMIISFVQAEVQRLPFSFLNFVLIRCSCEVVPWKNTLSFDSDNMIWHPRRIRTKNWRDALFFQELQVKCIFRSKLILWLWAQCKSILSFYINIIYIYIYIERERERDDL